MDGVISPAQFFYKNVNFLSERKYPCKLFHWQARSQGVTRTYVHPALLSFPRDLKEKEQQRMERPAVCALGCGILPWEHGSVLFTEEHMVFCLNEQENVLW